MLSRDHKFEEQTNILPSPESTSAEIVKQYILDKAPVVRLVGELPWKITMKIAMDLSS